MEKYIVNNMIDLHKKIKEPLYYNGYISMDERINIREYVEKLEQALNEIKELVEELSDNTDDTTCYEIDKNAKDDILQIIDKEDSDK